MTDTTKIIGQMVISSSFGVGQVVGIDQVGAEKREFLIVECQNQKVKSFIPADDESTYRFIAEQNEFNKALSTLSSPPQEKEFASKKDRINYYKEQSQIQDLKIIVELLKELDAMDDRGSAENIILNKLVDTLALEYSTINKSDLETSKNFILDKIGQK